ncbi:MAG: DUF2891 domain-containing protein [Gemmatimonadaceae bacterium]
MSAEAASLTPELASKFATVALSHITREYPHKLDHVLSGDSDLRSPRQLHPVFFGSFDWHSCVHGYWLLATVLRRYPTIPEARRVRELFDGQLTTAKVRDEVDYLGQPLRATFERPYGWAWALMLAAELARHQTSDAKVWSRSLMPLTEAMVERFIKFLPKATYPSRVGTHFNSAFAITLALEYCKVAEHQQLRQLLVDKARGWFQADADCQAWEPGGDDFLSSALIEAECMRRAMEPQDFQDWLDRFLPDIGERQPQTLFEPATVSDRSDGKIAHLDGLNLSRAWCWKALASAWPVEDPRRSVALEASQAHLDASLPEVAGDYMGEHWLATFAVLALS